MEKLQKIFVTTLSWAVLKELVQVEQIKGKLKQASLKKVIERGWMDAWVEELKRGLMVFQ